MTGPHHAAATIVASIYNMTSATQTNWAIHSGPPQTATGSTVTVTVPQLDWDMVPYDSSDQPKLIAGTDYKLPDGSRLTIDRAGNYKIEDKDAKVTYRANRVREFNPYINASDLLEAFIKQVGLYHHVRQTEALSLPIGAFINYLIVRAAQRDGDSTDGLPTIESALAPKRARCLSCGRFLMRRIAIARVPFCSPAHMEHRLRLLVPDSAFNGETHAEQRLQTA